MTLITIRVGNLNLPLLPLLYQAQSIFRSDIKVGPHRRRLPTRIFPFQQETKCISGVNSEGEGFSSVAISYGWLQILLCLQHTG